VLYVVAGSLVILAGIKVAGWLPKRFTRPVAACEPPRAGTAPGGARDTLAWPVAGFLNGLMPCALVFSLALKAATASSVTQGAAWLFAFGLGTVPAMLLAGLLAHGLGMQSLRWLRLAAGFLVIALGLQAVWSGAEFFRVMLYL
jgi:sulfite exporter TauE/SafE